MKKLKRNIAIVDLKEKTIYGFYSRRNDAYKVFDAMTDAERVNKRIFQMNKVPKDLINKKKDK